MACSSDGLCICLWWLVRPNLYVAIVKLFELPEEQDDADAEEEYVPLTPSCRFRLSG